MTINQFGTRRDGLTYLPRTGAYGILERGGLIACAKIGYSDFAYDLPGGCVEAGETPEQALVREFREETGLSIAVDGKLTELQHYFIHDDGTPYNNLCLFFDVHESGPAGAKSEADHELVWLNPLQVIVNLKNEGYAWAFALWLRRRHAA